MVGLDGAQNIPLGESYRPRILIFSNERQSNAGHQRRALLRIMPTATRSIIHTYANVHGDRILLH